MNKYGSQIRERWQRTAPARTAELYDAESFFQDLGELTLARVQELSKELEQQTALSEDYLVRAGQLKTLQLQAEEMALDELEWPAPELSRAEEREEWEATATRDEALTEWAASWETTPPEDELDAMAQEWMLSTEFLRELATSTNPWTFSAEHSETISSSKEQRFQRFLQSK